jgi:hypothetical protein
MSFQKLSDKMLYQKLREMRYSHSKLYTIKEPLFFGPWLDKVWKTCREIRDELVPTRTIAYECFLRATSDMMIAEEMIVYCDLYLKQDVISITDAHRIKMMAELMMRIYHRKQLIIQNMEEVANVYPDSAIRKDIIETGMVTIIFDRLVRRYEAMEEKYPFLFEDD